MQQHRTIGFHPCVGKKASGAKRPTTVVIRNADGSHAAHELDEQQLLDFFTCGAVIAWRDAQLDDPGTPPQRRWAPSDEQAYEGYVSVNPDQRDVEREKLFSVTRNKRTGEVKGYQRLQFPAELVTLNLATDTIGVASGGLGHQIIEILLSRFPGSDVRVIGSTALKECREAFDDLLPADLRRKANRVRLAASAATAVPPEDAAPTAEDAEDDDGEKPSKTAAKDANAKFDAHRIAFALADEQAAPHFHRCSLRQRDWSAVTTAYRELEDARKGRVAVEQQFRQIHRAAIRQLVKDPRVPCVTIAVGDENDEKIDTIFASYETTLRLCVTSEQEVAARMAVLRAAHDRIAGARRTETEMEDRLVEALSVLPEYTEFLPRVKAMVDPTTGLPLGKYLGERIFGRLIAGFEYPIATRIAEPMRQSDIEKIAGCRAALTEAIAALERTGLREQPPIGNGQTREWILECERVLTERVATATEDARASLDVQLTQAKACHDAYRALVNAKKIAQCRSRNRAIAYMGLHVRQGGKYAGTPKELEFPRRRAGKGITANYKEELLRQAAYQWMTAIIKGGDSYWKVRWYQQVKDERIARGVKRGRAHNAGFWRAATNATRWLLDQWFDWERARSGVVRDVEPEAATVAPEAA